MPYIKPEIIDKVFETADIVQVIQKFVDLKKSGANFKGLSPFTDEKTPSFMVSPSKGIWKDFATGKGGSNAISFLMQHQSLTYPEAIEWLANYYAIPIEYDNSEWAKEQHQKQEKKEALRPLLEAAIKKFQEVYQSLSADHPARVEVEQRRGYTPEIIEEYGIGYAPGGDFIYKEVAEIGRVTDAVQIGLVSDKGYDKWKDRVIYPLIQKRGTSLLPVGLAGRALKDPKKYGKWINSSDSELYHKETFWYGLDKAREAIVKNEEAWLVEGYNDVIAWQTNGILNTVAGCGTAVARKQMRVLKKLCEKVVMCFDPDGAGKKAMLKYIPEFIREGFRVQVVFLCPALDPDDFIRFWKKSIDAYGLGDLGTNTKYRTDGFSYLMQESFRGKDEVEIAVEAQKLCEIIKCVSDEGMRTIYANWLNSESNVGKSKINAWTKIKPKDEIQLVFGSTEMYELPETVKEPLEKLKPTIERYQLFMANHRIYVQTGTAAPFKFVSVSNFDIEIIQHMQDEKYPKKLVRISNVHGLERIFDMESADMNSPQAFENAVTAHGNFRWRGGRKEHELLKTFLFDGMGTGRKIDVLGWQPEGFWVWNNKITVPGGDIVDLNENGVFERDGVCYYVPSANDIYKNNLYKYEPQKKIVFRDPSVTFENYSIQLMKVHREHAISGLLFTIASMFQDIVVSELGSFPMLFLFGPASSGKDQLADVCQSFFGTPQTAINLEGGVSTIKAQVREFAQFCNLISQLSEYKNGNPQLDGVLKGLWDRRGYKRGNLDSHVGTDSIPILSSVLMTGNYAPDQEALITRFIWEFMDKTTFSDAETKEYEKLSDMTKKGISGFTEQFLKHRDRVKNNFKAKYREFKATLAERNQEANSRMVQNLAVLGTFHQMFFNAMPFPFSAAQMLDHFDKTIDKQMNKMSSASIINRWWDCFIVSMRGTFADQLKVGHDMKLEGDLLYFNFTGCYMRIQRQWFTQFRDSAPAKGVMMDAIKLDKSFVQYKNGERMASGVNAKSTSVYVVNVKELNIEEEIKSAVDFQLYENTLFGDQKNSSDSPATPENKKNDTGQGDLPF